ncbi:MAG: hypothetical protein M3143_12745 [Actinomycetota bacterium]|nr:hypothetical protein [Actinomycetota bacterium]
MSGAAQRNLQTVLLRRCGGGDAEVAAETRFAVTAQRWFTGVRDAAQAGNGQHPPSTPTAGHWTATSYLLWAR